MKLPARIFTKGTRRGKNDLTYLIAWEGDFGHVSALDLGAFRSEYIVSEWLDTPKYRHAKGDDHEAIDSYNRDGRPMVHLVGVEYRGKVVASVGIGSEHAMMTAAELLRDAMFSTTTGSAGATAAAHPPGQAFAAATADVLVRATATPA